jgi:hypothetical protein
MNGIIFSSPRRENNTVSGWHERYYFLIIKRIEAEAREQEQEQEDGKASYREADNAKKLATALHRFYETSP